MRYHTVIWDWNGTLLQDAHLCCGLMNGLLSQRRLPAMSRTRYEDLFDIPVSTYYARLGFDLSRESFEQLGNDFMAGYEAHRHRCRLQPGTRRTLGALRDRGVRQAVLSAYRQDSLETLLEAKGLAGYFTAVVGASDHYARGKTEQGKRLRKALGNDAGRTILIGDTRHDAEVAEAMGIDCALVYGGHQSRSRLAATGRPTFDHLDALRRWLLEQA